MGSTTTNTTTSSSSPSSPTVQATTDTLASKLGALANQSPAAYGKSLYTGVGPTTKNAWALGSNAATGLINSGGLSGVQQGALANYNGINAGYGALGDNGGLSGIQSNAIGGLNGLIGAYDQNSPGYQAMRTKALNDAVQNVGEGFTASGRFGGGSYINDATNAAVNAIAPLDYSNFQNSIENQKGIYNTLFGYGQQGVNNRLSALAGQQGVAGSLFSAGQQGLANRNDALSALGAIGAAQDADAQAARQGEYDLYTRQQEAPLQWLQGVTSAAAGNAANAGTTQNSTTQVPWWEAILGAGATGAGIYGAFQK